MATRAYDEIQNLIRSLGGAMEFSADGHGSGGDWILTLRGREARIAIHDRMSNDLDQLFVLKPGADPDRWEEDALVSPPRLIDDAFWVMIDRLPWAKPR